VTAALVAAVLGLLAGLGAWVHLVYEETPGPREVSIVAARGNDGVVAFRLDRYADSPAPVSDFVTSTTPGNRARWVERPPGTLRLRNGPGRATYDGAVDERVTVRFETGPDGGRARVVADGRPGRVVSLDAPDDGTRAVAVELDAQVPGAAWALLVLMLAVATLWSWATVWAIVRLGSARGASVAIATAAGSSLVAFLVAVLLRAPVAVDGGGGALPALDRLGTGVAVGLAAALLGSLVLGVRPPAAPAWVTSPQTSGDRWRLTLLLGAVPFVGWLALQLLFWPGLMNPDMAVQWVQVDRTGLDNWHPYMIAVVIGALRHVVDSPALPVLLQTVGASLLVGRIAAWTVWRRRSPWVAAAFLVLLPVLPPTGLFTITLWKDTPFGIAVLALALVVWRVEDTKGEWLRDRTNIVLAIVTALGLLLSRHTAWPILLATLVVLLLAHRSLWRRFVVVGGVTLVVAVVVQLPLASLLDVRASRVESIVYVQHIANHVNRGVDLTASEKRELRPIYPLDRMWPYSCHSIQPTWSGRDAIALERFQDKGSELRSIAIALALRDPGGELDHLACASELVWNPADPDRQTYFLEWSDTSGHVDYIPHVIGASVTEDPASPRALNRIYDVVVEQLPIWTIRPALYLYAFLVAIAFAAWRRRSWSVVWIAVPVLAQSITLAALNLVQDVRFQYGVMLTAVVLVPALLTVARRSGADDDAPLRWDRRDETDRSAPADAH
jgi:hypothetical protein